MPSSYTSLLGLVLPTTGDLNGTWGGVLNASLTQLIEDGVAGYATASVTIADWTLSTTGGGVTNEARMAVLIITGAPGTSRNVYAPKLSKQYAVINGSDSAIVFRGGPGTPTTGVTLLTGTRAIIAWDTIAGDFKFISPLSNSDGSVPNAVNLTGSGTVSATTTGGAALTPTSAGNLTGTPAFFAPITNSLSVDISMISTATFYDGPSVAQGTVGKWFASGTVTVQAGGTNDTIYAKLWDGTTVIAACLIITATNGPLVAMALSGYINAPVGNIRISVRDVTAIGGRIACNVTNLGSKDSTITAFRIG